MIWIYRRLRGMCPHLYQKQGPRSNTRFILSADGPQIRTHILSKDVSDIEGILLVRGLF